jgi:hypothetical protein
MHWLKSLAANIYVDFAPSFAVVSELADPALRLAWLSPSEKAQIALGIGLAGLSCANEVPRFTNGLRVETVHDAVTACIGAEAASRFVDDPPKGLVGLAIACGSGLRRSSRRLDLRNTKARGSAPEGEAVESAVMTSILDVLSGREGRHSSRRLRLEAEAARMAR